ncbi:penicillin-insensitive murein endopeptidase [Ostreibacterium oceani]|nr:penicillin-insensitive murein endopeptidase [Ostreibacterium oceani]
MKRTTKVTAKGKWRQLLPAMILVVSISAFDSAWVKAQSAQSVQSSNQTNALAISHTYQPENKPDNAWSVLSSPALGPSEPIGSYANGCMQGASVLPETGTGYQSMRRHRNRYYGQPELIRFVEQAGVFMDAKHEQRLLIGDLSQVRGGPMNYGHSSHQTGLDVDIWLQSVFPDEPAHPNRDMRSIVDKAAGTVIAGGLTPAMRDALYFSATYDRVERIFVNPVIKLALCQQETDTRWLQKLRPWWGHDSHFHVRLACPAHVASCESQAPIPAGDGCDDDLVNWVNEQSDIVTGKIKPSPKPTRKKAPKQLPTACETLLTN